MVHEGNEVVASGRMGLALGGGGARGLAHIGVLKVLERNGIAIDMLAGTSMGGLLGALYSAGIPLPEIEAGALELAQERGLLGGLGRLVDLALFAKSGIVKGQRIYDELAEMLGEDRTFADLDQPFAVVACDALTGQEVILREGRVAEAVRSTISVPLVFVPVERDGLVLVDGGILNNVPTDVVRDMGADTVIAVDVLPALSRNVPGQPPSEAIPLPAEVPSLLHDAYTILMIMLSGMTHWRLEAHPPDLLIRPKLPPEVGLLAGFERAAEIIAAGERAAESALGNW